MEFGIGKQEVASIQNSGVAFPVKLKSKVCTIPVLFKNQFENTHYIGAVGEYLGQSLSDFEVLDEEAFDSIKQEFTFCLPFAPIQRGNISLNFRLPSGELLEINDDRRGVFISMHGSGTIDYKTGACYLTTKFNFSQVDSMEMDIDPDLPDPTEGRTTFSHTLTGGDSIVCGSVWLTFTIGENANQRTFMVNDTPNPNKLTGTFTHPFIKYGTINYSTKRIDITFSSPLVDPAVKLFNCRYSFPIDYTLPEGTVLLASYFFTQQSIFITEAGFRNKDGVLLNYATFPPFEFTSTSYHLSFMILVRKP